MLTENAGRWRRRSSWYIIAIAFISALVPGLAMADGPSPIALTVSLRTTSPSADPKVMIAIRNVADDDYGLYPVQWLLIQHGGHNFAYMLVQGRKIAPVYAAVPAAGVLYLASSPSTGKIEAVPAPSWITLSGLRKNYGTGLYVFRYCLKLAGRESVCSNPGSTSLH